MQRDESYLIHTTSYGVSTPDMTQQAIQSENELIEIINQLYQKMSAHYRKTKTYQRDLLMSTTKSPGSDTILSASS